MRWLEDHNACNGFHHQAPSNVWVAAAVHNEQMDWNEKQEAAQTPRGVNNQPPNLDLKEKVAVELYRN